VELEPVFENDEIIAVGLNSARRVPFYGGGRLSERQVTRAAARLKSAPEGLLKVVVTHHPFDLPEAHRERDLIGRSGVAMRRLADAGVDLFLAGHLHVSHVGHAAERYELAGHSALVVQAGTMSMRTRGEANTMNVLNVSPAQMILERYTWDESRESFAASWRQTFHRTEHGWF
jgi:3',5'-cyclic AMP phosphodiesterase CpdA